MNAARLARTLGGVASFHTTKYRRAVPAGTPLLQGPVFVDSRGKATIYVWCPYCRKSHIHGWDPDAPPWAVSHRTAHCSSGPFYDGSGYYIRQAPRLRMPPGYRLREAKKGTPHD